MADGRGGEGEGQVGVQVSRAVIGFVFGVLLGGVVVHAQEGYEIGGLTMREVVEILAEYDVRHIDVPYALPWFGMTVPDERTIYLVKQMDATQRKRTMLHELCHVALWMRAQTSEMDEEVCKVMSDVEYRKYFGVDAQ
jgi:hypothetical protein